jgi:hypothetical protein
MNVANAAFNTGRIVGLPSDHGRLRESISKAVPSHAQTAPRARPGSARRGAQCEVMLRRAIDCCADTPSRPLRHIRTSAFMAGSRYAQLAGDARADLRLPYAAAAMVKNKRPRNEGEESWK